MKKLTKILIATGLTIVIVVAMGLISYFLPVENAVISVPMEQKITVKDGVATPGDMRTEFLVEKTGDYAFYTEFTAEQRGMITGMIIYDKLGNNVFSFTAESCQIESKIMELKAGKYVIVSRFLANETDLTEFLKEADLQSVKEGQLTSGENQEEEQYEFADNLEMTMKYRFEVQNRQSYSAGKRFGVACGILVGILLIYMIFVLTKTGDSIKNKYDERQEMARGRGYKYGFFSMLIWDGLLILFNILDISFFADIDVLLFSGVAIGITVYACYCIWNDGYYALNDNRRRMMIAFALLGLSNICLGVVNFMKNEAIEDGKLTYRSLNLLCGIILLVILVVTFIKDRKDRKEGADEES